MPNASPLSRDIICEGEVVTFSLSPHNAGRGGGLEPGDRKTRCKCATQDLGHCAYQPFPECDQLGQALGTGSNPPTTPDLRKRGHPEELSQGGQ